KSRTLYRRKSPNSEELQREAGDSACFPNCLFVCRKFAGRIACVTVSTRDSGCCLRLGALGCRLVLRARSGDRKAALHPRPTCAPVESDAYASGPAALTKALHCANQARLDTSMPDRRGTSRNR